MAEQGGYIGAYYTARLHSMYVAGAGDGSGLQVLDAVALDFGNMQDFTIEFWAQIAAGGAGTIVSKDAGANLYEIVESGAGEIMFLVNDGIGANAISAGTPVDGMWHHWVFIRDTAANRLWIYVDGVADPVGGAAGRTGDLSNAANLVFGNSSGLGSDNTACRFGEIKMYDRALTAAEVLAHYNGGDGMWMDVDTNTRALWHVDEGAGDAVNLVTGGNPITLVNNAAWSYHYDIVAADACAGGPLIYTTTYSNIDTVTVYDGGVAVAKNLYTLTPAGTITFAAAPGGAVTADYHVIIPSGTGGFHQWNIDWSTEALDATDFAAAGEADVVRGVIRWTATAQRHWCYPSKSYIPGTTIIAKFWWDEANNKRFEGWALITGMSPNCPANALIEETITFTGSDGLAIETV